jgi:hypothetical protein
MATMHNRQRMRRVQWLDTVPACAGPCDNGRKLCPCPGACGITPDPERGEPLTWRTLWHDTPQGARIGAVIVLVILVAAAIAHAGAVSWAEQ